jgi:hypothetical protein
MRFGDHSVITVAARSLSMAPANCALTPGIPTASQLGSCALRASARMRSRSCGFVRMAARIIATASTPGTRCAFSHSDRSVCEMDSIRASSR